MLFMMEAAGLGIRSEFEARRSALPVTPTVAENASPALERSIRYHRTGLTRARVNDACISEAQGSLRFIDG